LTTVLIFAAALLAASLISALAHRSILSTAVLFLFLGAVLGRDSLGLIGLSPDSQQVRYLAELALVSILFTDGMKVGLPDLTSAWSLPGRALLLGLPLTLAGSALLAHWVAGLSWPEAFLVGAILSPTDPVFAAAIVGREEISPRLRHLLNVESGLNDGLALPLVIAGLALVDQSQLDVWSLLGELVTGVGIGILVPWIAIRLDQSFLFGTHSSYQPLFVFGIGLFVYALTHILGANEFLAAFAAGVTTATCGPKLRQAFEELGELIAELLKLAALLVFGSLITPHFLAEIPANGYLFAVLVIIVARPLALILSLLWSKLAWPETAAAAWFGPKGFASVVFGLYLVTAAKSGQMPWQRADHMFHLVALCITASIVAHSSTDVPWRDG
jgi:NhaP-type Na+/H+ or K+/H+ antiporter